MKYAVRAFYKKNNGERSMRVRVFESLKEAKAEVSVEREKYIHEAIDVCFDSEETFLIRIFGGEVLCTINPIE